MNWCVGNAKTERKGNAVLVTKEVSKGKIDPLMALFNAVALMSRVQSAAPPEVVVLDIAA
jgi:phage terminase large subunit-like protein